MTESYLKEATEAHKLFDELSPKECQSIDLIRSGRSAIENANIDLGLALSEVEIDYLLSSLAI
jgi:phosphoribosylformylglycinamidine synthase